jgi:hypothetical protein
MGRRITETLTSTVDVCLMTDGQRRVLFEGTGSVAALEVMGDLDRLLAEARRG